MWWNLSTNVSGCGMKGAEVMETAPSPEQHKQPYVCVHKGVTPKELSEVQTGDIN